MISKSQDCTNPLALVVAIGMVGNHIVVVDYSCLAA